MLLHPNLFSYNNIIDYIITYYLLLFHISRFSATRNWWLSGGDEVLPLAHFALPMLYIHAL